MNAVTFALPILPFDHEGATRRQTAVEGVSKLKESANFTIVLDNNKLTEYVADMPVADALKVVDRSVLRIVESVSNQASSYVSNMMEDILGYSDMVEESAPAPPTEIRETQLIHADLDPMFNDFGPSMFG
jgi:cell division GTPase FtsZ